MIWGEISYQVPITKDDLEKTATTMRIRPFEASTAFLALRNAVQPMHHIQLKAAFCYV